MPRRQGIVEDLIITSAQLPWSMGLGIAIGLYVILGLFHLGPFGQILRIGLPFALLIGAGFSTFRQHQAKDLFDSAHVGGGSAVAAMSWSRFERLVGEAFRRQGYGVTENLKGGPDGGVDLVLTKGDSTYLVQCKHWKAWSVGAQVVRELKGVMAMRSAAGGFVVTSGKFTREAAEFALKAGIELLDGNELIAIVRGTRTEGLAASPHGSSVGCPRCGGVMVLRTARRGRNAGSQLWGCPRYPVCKGTRAA